MGKVFEKDGRLCVTHIPGPSHNFLGLKLSAEPTETSIRKLEPAGSCDHGPIDESKLESAVLEAISRVAEEAGTTIHVSEIAYVPNDSPRYDAYAICAHQITRHYIDSENAT